MNRRLAHRLLPIFILAACGAYSADSTAERLKSQVTIYRDHYGVPHIIGDSEEATFFGYGYAQAQDHLEKMMIQYRDAQGRRSEVLGRQAIGEKSLGYSSEDYRCGGDYLQRLLRTWQCVADNKRSVDPAVFAILDAFARGVNYYIAENRSHIPAWIDEVSPVDIEALERSDYLRFYSIADALSKLSGEPLAYKNFGSNQWAIAPQKSVNGRIIHVEHMHTPWANRFQNYEAHLITPGKLDVAGISWFGSPFFLVGFNEKISWSATWNQPNIADVYEEAINPKNERQYLYEGQWSDVRVEWTTLRVKESNSAITRLRLPLYYTHHGPIVKFDNQRHRAYAVKLPNFDGVNYSTGLYALMRADSVESFRAALARQLIPRWNFLCTDSENIFWVHNAVVARRNQGFDWTKPVPGWVKDTEWGPYLPFSSNPQLLNPRSGFLQNCNNPPWLASRNSGLKELDPVPYYLASATKSYIALYRQLLQAVGLRTGEEALNARGQRVFELLTQPEKRFTLDEMIRMGFDTYVLAADAIVPLLNRASASAQPITDLRLRKAMDDLSSWDRRASADSCAFTYLYYWAKAYQSLYSTTQFERFNGPSRSRIDINSVHEQQQAWRALKKAVDLIQAKFGKTDVRWGEINVVIRGDRFQLDGTSMFDVLHPDKGLEQQNGEIRCDDGWGHLMIVMEGEPKRVWSLLPFGESEHADSPHYNDQAKLHSQQRVKPFWFSRREILENTESIWGDPKRL